MRKCVNTGSFSNPVYTCQEARREVMSNNPFDMFYKRAGSFNLVILVVKQTTESAADAHEILKGEKCESVLT